MPKLRNLHLYDSTDVMKTVNFLRKHPKIVELRISNESLFGRIDDDSIIYSTKLRMDRDSHSSPLL